jgi:hypothetical protein
MLTVVIRFEGNLARDPHLFAAAKWGARGCLSICRDGGAMLKL